MSTLRLASITRRALPLLLGAVGFCIATVVFGGEKIQISGGAEKIELPAKALRDDLFSKPLEFLRSRGGDGGGSMIPTLPPPSEQTTTRQQQLEKKNLFSTTRESVDQEAALMKIFGVRDYTLDGLGKKSTGSFEDPMERPSGRKNQTPGQSLDDPYGGNGTDRSRRSNPADAASPLIPKERGDRSGFAFDDDVANGNTPIAELNLNNLLNPAHAPDALSRGPDGLIRTPNTANILGNLLNQASAGQSGRTRDQELRSQEFDKLLKGLRYLPKPINDPINGLPDGTRQEINPVSGRRLEDFSSSMATAAGGDPFGGFSKPSRASPFDSLGSKVLGASSLAPAVVAPAPPPIVQAPPPVLEIPRRKF